MTSLEEFSLRGRTVVVTGGSGGLGAAGAAALATAGARIGLIGRSAERLCVTARRIGGDTGREAAWAVADVSDSQAVRGAFAQLMEDLGHLDVLVNNAGQAYQQSVDDINDDAWDRVLDVNLRGVFLCVRSFLAAAASTSPRVIVNISSLAGTVGVRGQAAYAASKGGVESFTRALAIELAPRNVRVNALAPGYFRTSMPAAILADEDAYQRLLKKIPQKRIAEPLEIGPPLVFLASDASRYMTGAVLHFDGGYTAQ